MREKVLPDYYDLVLFGIHHFGISSICNGKQMSEAERELRIILPHFSSMSLFSVSLNLFFFPFLMKSSLIRFIVCKCTSSMKCFVKY